VTIAVPTEGRVAGTDAPAEAVDTVVVGAGFAGLGMGIRLARAGHETFVLLERGADVGGTWRDNVYPGVACDIPSHLYSFSFAPKSDWSHFYAPGAEIQGYLRECAREIAAHVRLGTEVLEARWLDDDERWLVRTSRGDYLASTVVLAAGRLTEPRMPAIPGLGSFPGEVVHSARWPDHAELAGLRVGVVGTGASAVQLVPRLAETAASVVVFQRSAPWIVPRGDRDYTPAETRGFGRDPASRERLRSRLFWKTETGFAERTGVAGPIDGLRARAAAHLRAQVGDPGLRDRLTPRYEIGCKRVLLSDDFYPAVAAPHVTLEASALDSVDGSWATAAGGARHELDVLVFATGFESTRPPFAGIVRGRDGLLLADAWSEGMAAYNSTAVHGFPNLFVLDGPNASLGHGSAIAMIEAQVGYVLDALAASARVLEVTAEAQARYVDELDRAAASTVWLTGGCSSWYVDDRSGRLTLLWPDFAYRFRDRLAHFDPTAYRMVGGGNESRTALLRSV
jgi:cation diffusion facilitator CzcD-associated flavoprotein CzcO